MLSQGNWLFRKNLSSTSCELRFISEKAQSPQAPPSLGPQSWQVCLLEGCTWEQTKVPQEIPHAAQAWTMLSCSLVCSLEPA